MANREIQANNDQSSGEESDALDIVFESTTSSAGKNQKPTDNEIELVCLDDSDSDASEGSVESVSCEENVFPPATKKNLLERVDYLNLDSSDTDGEQEIIKNSVNNLLRSAAILNDIECGPTKPMPELKTLVTPPSCTDDTPLCGKRSSSSALVIEDQDVSSTTSLAIDTCNNVCLEENLSNKKIKLDQPTTDSKDVNVTTVEELNPLFRMYRKDDRIVAAYKRKGISHIPSTVSQTVTAHENTISSLSWCAVPHSHLLLSSSLDGTVKIWDIYSKNKPIQTLYFPLGVRAAKWSRDGEEIIVGGFGKEAHVIDALSGRGHITYDVYNYVSCITIHPFIEDFIFCGTNNAIFGFDLRVNSQLPVKTYMATCGEILDIAFLNQTEFVCSTSIVSRDSADRTLIVWDFNSGAVLSNQIYSERHLCPSLKVNPFDSSFIAQTNGDYIASFSSRRPYKRKMQTFIGHKNSGYKLECDISPDGRYVASGDAKGDVYFYNYEDATVENKLTIEPDLITNSLKWHPVLSSTMAVSTSDGQIHLLK